MQQLIELLTTNEWLFWTLAGLIGLCIGSYINVIIYRYPKLLAYQWHKECYQFLALSPKKLIQKPPFSLNWPASHCPHCTKPIRFYDNIPILSYLILGGRCRQCQGHISLQYPLIESLALICSVITTYHFGFTLQAAAGLIFTWWLICQAGIDIKEQLIPDQITYLGLWIGLLLNTQLIFTTPSLAIYGAVAGYLSLWLIFHLYKIFTGKEGMGYGDFKLLAMLGAWLGVAAIPWLIILSSLLGLLGGMILIMTRGITRETPIPFGPYLALAGWLFLLFGTEFYDWYWQWIG